MVTYITRIILPIEDEYKSCLLAEQQGSPAAKRQASILELLAGCGFVFHRKKNKIIAESTAMEAQAAKSYLLEQGIEADEFQVYLEYTRQWGML